MPTNNGEQDAGGELPPRLSARSWAGVRRIARSAITFGGGRSPGSFGKMRMWPFGKSKSSPVPPSVTRGDMTARYDPKLKEWSFECEGIEFGLSGVLFNEEAFNWARESVGTVRTLNDDIRNRVLSSLVGVPCNKSKARILCVNLDEYTNDKTLEVTFIGDESWGDLGIDVVITDGKIVGVYGGD